MLFLCLRVGFCGIFDANLSPLLIGRKFFCSKKKHKSTTCSVAGFEGVQLFGQSGEGVKIVSNFWRLLIGREPFLGSLGSPKKIFTFFWVGKRSKKLVLQREETKKPVF